MKRIAASLGVVVALAGGALGVRSLADDGSTAQASVMANAGSPAEACDDCTPSPERANEACGPGGCSPPVAAQRPKTRCCAPAWDTAGQTRGEASTKGFDPVCRELVDIDSAAATRNANGLTFHFCSEEHAQAFDADRLEHLYCPVFKGSRVNPSISAQKDGKTYYFCCEACKVRFLQGGGASGAFLGVRLALDAEKDEIRIDGVIPDSPAARAGIQAGMIIVAVDGQAVDGPQRFLELMGTLRPGQDVELRLRSPADERTVKVSLGQRSG